MPLPPYHLFVALESRLV